MLGADIMKRIHGNMDLDHLVPTEVEHVYKTDRALFPYVYLNGYYYFELNPWALYELGFRGDMAMKPAEGSPNYLASIEHMTKRFNGWADSGEWETLFGCIDKKIGLSMFINSFDRIPSRKIYDSFIEIYQRSEFGFEVLVDYYEDIFALAHCSKKRDKRLRKLSKKIKHAPEIIVFHGAKLDDDPHNPCDYYSWTLDEKVATWFAKRYQTPGQVWRSTIDVRDAVDYLADRSEEEILINYATMDKSGEVRRDV